MMILFLLCVIRPKVQDKIMDFANNKLNLSQHFFIILDFQNLANGW